MSLIKFNKQSKLQASWIGLSMATVMIISGCNNADTTTDEAVVDEQTEVAVVETPETAVATPAVVADEEVFVMTTLGLDSINNLIFTPLIAGDTLNEEQKTCLAARDSTLGQAELQAFYKEKFTEAELDELAAFYDSEVGEKLLEYGRQEIVLMNGGEVATPIADPTAAEVTEIQTFMQTPTGMKYTQINNEVGDGSAIAALDAPMNAEFSRCNIDLTMAQLMQPAPAAG